MLRAIYINLMSIVPPHDPKLDLVIDLAWADEISFDEIKLRTGYAEKEVILIMRRHLKPSSFRMWRKRVSGRVTKHQKRLQSRLGQDFDPD